MRVWPIRCLIVVTLAVAAPALAADALSPEQLFDRGQQAFQRGALPDAVTSWTAAASVYEKAGKLAERYAVLMPLAHAYSALGQYRNAVTTLETALGLAEGARDTGRVATVLARLGDAHLALGPPETAESFLRRSLDLARKVGGSATAASALNSLGNLLATQSKYPDAVAAYTEGAGYARQAKQPALVARLLANAARAQRQSGQPEGARASLDAALDEMKDLAASHDNAYALIGIGVGYRDLRAASPDARDALTLRAAKILGDAGTMAGQLSDDRAISYASGYLATLYEEEHRWPEALQLTRRAILAAQRVTIPESLYQWQWQAGRLLTRLGATDDALASYRRAVATLQSIRTELSATYGAPPTPFREAVGPVYFELVDLLLKQVPAARSGQQRDVMLVEAREVVELFKAAELRDFFRDDCVDTALSKITSLDVVSQTAAVVYPIVLPDRIELLVTLPAGLKHMVVPVSAEMLTQEVRQFRLRLEKRTTRQYLPHAQKLYEWLIRPMEADLTAAKIDTLVFVPDGPLRTIPMAALHDGKQFLVSKYALGITPGLRLTDPRPLKREGTKVLAVGVTEPVQGFTPLPNVTVELDALRTLFGSTTLLNREFRIANLEKKLREEEFTILHIASHGEFGSAVDKTFLLSFDEKLTVNRLDQMVGVLRYRDEPLELLTLSACDTAAGDDRAALGLAGVAIKAGARSAVATLWAINDDASAGLIADFYRELHDPSISRAVALQRAQVRMLSDPRFEHPGFWAPFLLINNWL